MNNSAQNNHIFLNKVLESIPVILILLMPIFFLPITTEFFEFNKQMLLLAATVAMLLLWSAKIALGGKFEITKSNIDIPLFALGCIFLVGSIFSLNKTISIFGSQSRWFPSLLGLLTVITFYYLSTTVVKTLSTIKLALHTLILSATISSTVALLAYYKIFLGKAFYLQVTNFNLAGSITTAIVIAAIGCVAASLTLVYATKPVSRILLTISALLNFLLVLVVNITIGWALLLTGLVAGIMYTKLEQVKLSKIPLAVLAGACIILIALTFVPVTKAKMLNTAYPKELSLSLRDSWIIAASTIQEYPILATGPSTFELNFSRYRPLSLNAGPTWDVRFDKPYNELINVIATTGLVGLATFLFLGYCVFKLAGAAKTSSESTGITRILSVLLLTSAVTFLFTYATVLNTFVFFALLSMLVIAHALAEQNQSYVNTVAIGITTLSTVPSIFESGVVKKDFIKYIFMVPFIAGAIYLGIVTYKIYAAEYLMKKSIDAAQSNNGSNTYAYQAAAIGMNPNRDTYLTAFAQTNMMLANSLASKKDLSDNEKQAVQNLISDSIKSIRNASEVVNPLSVYNWEVRAAIYRNIIGVAENASDWTIASYSTAIQLDPTNPRLRIDLGGVYYAKEDYLSAANQFRQATSLKADYANAHYNFAEALLKLKDNQGAKRELEATRALLDQNSEDYKKVDAEIATIPAEPAVAGTTTTKPTVEQLTNTTQKPVPNQEPLKTVGEPELTK